MAYTYLLDLLRQIAGKLQPAHGGTGSAYGEGRTVVRMLNATGADLELYSLVQPTFGANDLRVAKVASAGSKTVLGPVVGYYDGDGQLVEADAPDGFEVAVQTSGVARVLIVSSVSRADYAFSSTTAGKITSSSSGAVGAFGLVIDSADVSTGTTWARVFMPATAAVGGGASFGTPALTLGTANAAGAASTGIRTDASIALFDATVPTTAAFGDAAATGSDANAARRDHLHGMPANPSPAFATPAVALASSAAAGAASTVIRSDSTIAAFDATNPSTQAFSDSPAVGSAAFAARRDHKHGMPADPSGGGGGIASGTSFPGSPATNDIFRRTDLGSVFRFDGTRWLSLEQYTATLRRIGDQPEPATATQGTSSALPLQQALYIEAWYLAFYIATGGTALGASHKWVATLKVQQDASTASTIGTISIDSGASNAWRASSATGLAYVGTATDLLAGTTLTKTGTPGNLYSWSRITYRLIAT